jgi:hypothetical protein
MCTAIFVHVRCKFQLDVHGFVYSLFLYIFALHVSGAICTDPQEHKLQRTALGVCNGYGILVHWSRYWLGHPHTFSTVKFGLSPNLTCTLQFVLLRTGANSTRNM